MRRLFLLGASVGNRRRWSKLSFIALAIAPMLAAPILAMQGPGGGENAPFSSASESSGASLFTGTATVTIPILIPPGRTNATPDLKLSYSSHAGLSEVGLGWSLTLGSITRSRRHGVPRCSGGHTEDYRVTLNDSSNELVRVGSDLFHLRIDEAFAQAVPDVTGNSWTLHTRDGLTYHFGETSSSRVHTGADEFFDDSSGCEFTTAWHLTRVEDPNGNFVAIEYERYERIPIPIAIEYGGNSEVPIEHPFRVRIESQPIPLPKTHMRTYRSGVNQILSRRIKTIIVEARANAAENFEEVRRYELHYDDLLSVPNFLLTSVSTTDLPDRVFSYSTSSPTIVDATTGSVPTVPGLLTQQFPDGPVVSIQDMNGDALMDRVRVVANAYKVSYGLAGQANLFTPQEYSWGMPTGSGVPTTKRIGAEDDGEDLYVVLDINGDGKPDFLYRDTTDQTILVHPGRCIQDAYDCGFSQQPEVWNNPGNLPLRDASTYDGGPFLDGGGRTILNDLLDMNADGLPDLLRAQATGIDVYFNDGGGFSPTPSFYETGDDAVGFVSNPNDFTIDHEIQLIDVNGDSLPDRVEGAQFHDWSETISNPPSPLRIVHYRAPKTYFTIDLNDEIHGPYDLASGGHFCPTTANPEIMTLCYGASGYVLPAGWAIVPAMSVRLNTGAGFADPIYSPSPFQHTAAKSAARLRASFVNASDHRLHPFRDFVDVNGDGLVDWVSSGVPNEAPPATWRVLYNQGNGYFGRDSLVRMSGTRITYIGDPVFNLGDVRPLHTLEVGSNWLGESILHTTSNPDGLSDQYAHIFDLDSDGIPEFVSTVGMTNNRWKLRKFVYSNPQTPHTKPLLMTKMANGLGGLTYFRYRPASDFVPESGAASDLPLSPWVVTGIRRTDGLCDEKPDDWFRINKNPCLASGHEVVQRIDYADGFFDGPTREFRGFGRVVVMDGPEELAAERHIRFYQDEVLKGRTQSEETYVGGVDLLSRVTYDWRTGTTGLRTQVYLQEQRLEEFVLYSDQASGSYADQCVVHRNSIATPSGVPDDQTRVHVSCSMPCEGALTSDDLCTPNPAGKKMVTTLYADPISSAAHEVWDRPATVATAYVDEDRTLTLSGMTVYEYDGLSSGVGRGNVSRERHLVDSDPASWIDKFITHDNDLGPGVGNIVSIDLPVSGISRDPISTIYDADFRLYPILNLLPTTVNRSGQAVEHRSETRFDFRYGKEAEKVGRHGRAAGDVSGAVYDSLGRPVCEYEPESSCAAGATFQASRVYEYGSGDPNAANPIDQLSWVEVRRREPNAPNGYLVTRTYSDALGRERITTSEQFIVDPPAPGVRGAMQTVVRRHLEYGSNGEVIREYAAYLPDASGLSLLPPAGTSFTELNYALNGNGGGGGFWDPAGRPWKITGHDLSTQREYFYGRTTRKVDALGNEVHEARDAHGRVVRREVHEGATTLLSVEDVVYNGRDQAIREWVGGDATTEIASTYDLLGHLVSRDDPDSGIWIAKLDEAGNTIHSDDPKSNQSVQSCFDELDRVVLLCGRSSDVYDPGLCSAAEPTCSVEYRFHYDEADHIASVDHLGTGQLTTVEGSAFERRWGYDVRGRVTHQYDEIAGVAGTTEFAYSAAADRLSSMTYPDGEIVQYKYDPGGQPQRLSSRNSVGTWLAYYVSNIGYDLLGRVVSVVRGNSTIEEYSYHGASKNFRVNEIVVKKRAPRRMSPSLEHLRVRYDDYDGNGRLTSIEDDLAATGPLSLSADYVFDAAGRLAGVGGAHPESFEYDGIGNIMSINGKPFSVDRDNPSGLGPHQFDRFGDRTGTHWKMAFDANGQRTSKTMSDGSSSQLYGFDVLGRMTSLTVDGVLKTLRYDHSGGRISETRNGETRRFFGGHAESREGLVHKYYFIGETLIATRTDPAPELSDAHTVAPQPVFLPPEAYWILMWIAVTLLAIPIGRSRITVGLRISQGGAIGSALLVSAFMLPLVIGTGCYGDESIRHYHLSQRSSPIAITGAYGALERQYRYSAYGEVRRYDGPGNPTSIDLESRREFTGYQTDPESELQYANARYYDPSQAQFISMDPEQENASPYAYAAWDPIDFTDPSGAEAFTLAFLVFMALSLAAVVVQAIITGVQTSSWSNGLISLVIGVGTLVAGTIAGMVIPGALSLLPGISQQAVQGALLATGVGSSTYGVATAGGASAGVMAGIGLALSLGGAAYALSSSSPSTSTGRAPSPSAKGKAATGPNPDGLQVARNGSNRTNMIDQMLKILRGSVEARIIRDAHTQNELEIMTLRAEATRSATVRGRPIGDNNVSAFEVMSFTVDSAGNQSFNDSIVTVEFSLASEPLPTRPSLIGAGNPPFVRTVVTGPHPIACRACSTFRMP